MALAAIDCGTNALRLLISEDGRDLVRELRIVRLGQGVDQTGRLDPAAIERARAVLVDYRKLMDAHAVSALRMVATSAARDASNAADFQQMVRATIGQDADVISGDEEAALSFSGSVGGLPAGGEYLVIDIGGGSTEFVRGTDHVTRSISVDVGSVRMTERHVRDDPPTPAQLEAMTGDIGEAVGRALSYIGTVPPTLVGVAGAVTTVAGIALGLQRYDAELIHHTAMSAEAVEGVAQQLCSMNHSQRAAIPVMHPGRVDVIIGGALILREIMRQTDYKDIIVSEHDILDGIVSSLAR